MNSEQTAGLGTAENEAPMSVGGSKRAPSCHSTSSGDPPKIAHRSVVETRPPTTPATPPENAAPMSVGGSEHAPSGSASSGGPPEMTHHSVVEARPPAAPSPSAASRKGLSFKMKRPRGKSHHQLSFSQSGHRKASLAAVREPDRLSLSESISRSAPTTLRSAMSTRTLDDSLGKSGTASALSTKPGRSIAFSQVNIREYERILGDNPCVSSGVPIGIGWRYGPDPVVMNLDDYEDGKERPRGRSEYLVPKAVREGLVQEHAGVGRRDIVVAVRAIQKAKAQRRRTVVNLGYQKTEERVEGARRKLKKILRPARAGGAVQAQLWDAAHAAAVDKAARLEDSIRNGESVGMRHVYSVGNPANNVVPSRRNSASAAEADAGVWQPRRFSLDVAPGAGQGGDGAPGTAPTTSPGDCDDAPAASAAEWRRMHQSAPDGCFLEGEGRSLPRSVSDGELALLGGAGASAGRRQRPPSAGGTLRHSAHIVADESENGIGDIFATLLLDDAGSSPAPAAP